MQIYFYEEEGCAQCADCGKYDIRPATEDEIAQYIKYREEFKNDNPNKKK